MEDKSRPSRDAWIETHNSWKIIMMLVSRPSRDAWIETQSQQSSRHRLLVASLAGRVD